MSVCFENDNYSKVKAISFSRRPMPISIWFLWKSFSLFRMRARLSSLWCAAILTTRWSAGSNWLQLTISPGSLTFDASKPSFTHDKQPDDDEIWNSNIFSLSPNVLTLFVSKKSHFLWTPFCFCCFFFIVRCIGSIWEKWHRESEHKFSSPGRTTSSLITLWTNMICRHINIQNTLKRERSAIKTRARKSKKRIKDKSFYRC